MPRKLPYPAWADVTPCSITIHGKDDRDGVPTVLAEWKGLVNLSEKTKRMQDADGKWVQVNATIHINGDICPGVVFTGAAVEIEGYPTRHVVLYARPRNPDGTANHTRLGLI